MTGSNGGDLAIGSGPKPRRRDFVRLFGRLAAVALGLAAFVVISALVGNSFGVGLNRALVSLAVLLGPPLALALLRWGRRQGFLLWPWAFLYHALLIAVLGVGFADVTGRALRRRGDWFFAGGSGLVAHSYRLGLARVALYLERFERRAKRELPPTLQPLLPTHPADRQIASDWSHPFTRRTLPPHEGCRFGAHRPGRRPAECEAGHCGIDLPALIGTPVHAVADGVVLRVERDEKRGGRAGRYVKLGHQQDLVRTRYVHLDRIAEGLSVGAPVRRGQLLGTVGLTGVARSAPHLHFSLSVKRRSRHLYIDPEPLMLFWPTARPVGVLPTRVARRE
ncbi:MAG: M23 family metallopeptidase [Deltaproteobacteria bacterium]|nr:M23 family metallopeptidase [Deltaproteobacteria bacterium]